ncbi:hypothetical protein L915_21842 [Phytophthora nicotianae]|uniref:Uncharacterized protein n=1 Tax=Phytophthora nicotianae TaxID=4792 RepID=W2FL98_PHYNI|nr:hypothetical protein L915_21842 [Phytophthora nicotianae]
MAVAGLNSRTQSDSSPSLGVRIMEQHLHQPGLLARALGCRLTQGVLR